MVYTDTAGDGIYDAYGYDAADQLTGDTRYNYSPSTGFSNLDSQAFSFNNDGFMTSLTFPAPLSALHTGWTATSQSNSDEINTLSVSGAFPAT